MQTFKARSAQPICCFLLVFSFQFASQAQTWIVEDQSWVYYFGAFIAKEGYEEMTVARDTVVDGLNCKVLRRDRAFVDFIAAMPQVEHTSHEKIVHEDGDALYYRVGNDFKLLYDLSIPKDSFLQDYGIDCYPLSVTTE